MIWLMFIIIIQFLFLLYLLFKPEKQLPTIFEINVHIDQDFSTIERISILDGLWEWEKETHGLVKFNVLDTHAKYLLVHDNGENSLNFVKSQKKDPLIQYLGKNYKNLMGLAAVISDARIIFLISDKIDHKNLNKLILHEIGHVLGLNHNSIPETIMYPYANKMSKNITKKDIEQFIYKIRNHLAKEEKFINLENFTKLNDIK